MKQMRHTRLSQRAKSVLVGCALAWSVGSAVRAQDANIFNIKTFDEAAVVLTTGTVRTGKLSLFVERDVLRLMCPNDSIYTLPARLVRGFAAKDDPTQQRKNDSYVALQRIYRTFPLLRDKGSSPVGFGFYEQLSRGSGPVLLLRREHSVPCEGFIGGNSLNASGERMVITGSTDCDAVAVLYLRTAAGDVVLLRKPKDVLDYFPRESSKLRAYAAENSLQYTSARDLALLVNYANTLIDNKP